MSDVRFDRRQWMAGTLGALGAASVGTTALHGAQPVTFAEQEKLSRPADEPFGYCFNTSTIRGQKLPIERVVEITAEAGYKGIEPWIRELDDYKQRGGSIADLAKKIRDLGLTVESAIGFAEWIVDDDARRAKGLEEAKRTMELVRQIGGTRIAAPPTGATDKGGMNLHVIAERYGVLLDLGREIGVVPQLEVWGFSKNLNRLGDSTCVCIESGRPDACLLPDIYHIRRGGSEFAGLKMLSGAGIHVFHVNDYPQVADRNTLTDAMRVYPGDGVAPTGEIFRTLHANGFRGMLSLELFNPDYWKQDPLLVAKTGLAKTRAAVKAAFKTA